MSEVTYYVALPFVAADGGIAPMEAIQCFSPKAAVMKAEALSRRPGCHVFFRSTNCWTTSRTERCRPNHWSRLSRKCGN
jgi:hypothetical protein